MEKVNETRLIFVSFLLSFSKLNNILSVIFLSLSTTNCLKPVKPKPSNSNRPFFGWISRKFHQHVPGLFSLSVLKIANGYFAIFSLCPKSLYILLLNLKSKHP